MEKKESFISVYSDRNKNSFCEICGKRIEVWDDPFGYSASPLSKGLCCTECYKNVVEPTSLFVDNFQRIIGSEIKRYWYIGLKNFKHSYINTDFNDFEFDVKFDFKTFDCLIEIFKDDVLFGYLGVENESNESPDKVLEKAAVKLYDFLKKNSK